MHAKYAEVRVWGRDLNYIMRRHNNVRYSLITSVGFRTLHEKDIRKEGGVTRIQFFLIALTCSFCYYALPGYLFGMLSSLSWVCWAWPRSVTAQQVGSGMRGLGVGAIGLDWATVSSYLGSPLATPFFAIANIFAGFLVVMYVITPVAYYNNLYSGTTFPIFSSKFFRASGERYDINKVIDPNFRLDEKAYDEYGRLHLSTFFAFTYGVGFAALTATLSHVILFHGWYSTSPTPPSFLGFFDNYCLVVEVSDMLDATSMRCYFELASVSKTSSFQQ